MRVCWEGRGGVDFPNKENENIKLLGLNSQTHRLQAASGAAKTSMCNSINLPQGNNNLTQVTANHGC